MIESQKKIFRPEHKIADNRKKVALERLREPFKEPEIFAALQVARSVLNKPIPKDFTSNDCDSEKEEWLL